MKHILITIAAVVLVGCGESQQSAPSPESKPVEPVAEVPAQQSAPAPEAKPVEPVIWEAIKEGNLEAVKQHFNSGIDVNIKVSKEGRSSQSWHPLNWAATNGQTEIVEFLLSRGAEVNSKDGAGYIALHYAAGGGSWRPHGYREVVEVLIANGEDVNTKAVDGSTPLDLAAMTQQKEIMDLIRKHSGKHGTFFGAVSGGDIEAVKKFLVAGVDTNKKSGRATPLMAAAASGHNETVELLISEGAEINVIMRDAIDRNLTAVDIAEQKGNKDTADLLRKHGGKTGEELKVESINEESSISKKLTAREAAEIMAFNIGHWETNGEGMPVGGTKQAIEMRREVRWKEEDESLEYKYTMNQNGEVVSYFGHEEYDAAKGVFVYRSKWGESPETTSHASYNPATRTSHAQTVTTKSGAKTKTVTTTKRVGNDKIQQNLRVFENGQLVYTHDVVSTRIEENKQ